MKRSPELEAMAAADNSDVSNQNAKRNQTAGMAALLIFGVIAAYMVLATSGETPRDNPQSDEEFQTTTFRPPNFVRDGEQEPVQEEQPIVQLPPPPPPPPPPQTDTTTFNVPPPPEVVQPPEAAPVEEVFPERFKSRLITLDQNRGGNPNDSLTGNGGTPLTVAGEDRNSQYLSSASAIGDRSAKARQIKRIDAMIPEGTLIPGILETAIVSDLPGQIRAITSQDVYSFDGRRVLIPTGTRLIGEYQSEVTRGQKRIFVVWTRLIRDDGVSVRLNSMGADSLGRSGLTGHVDNKFRERFGASILLSIVGGGASYLTGYGSDSTAGSNNDDAQRASELARETIAQTFSDMANTVLSENLRIPPTISVAQGERIFIFVRQDLDFSEMYDDPVTEAMKEIKRERAGK
ncbi:MULTISPECIES: type IV secretion system protein VirB10 [Agrobacterium]|uniref:type IV secretion system protein VirB10 n=1 Tax=Agrobacterium TaxID=357 RepID=UPI0009BAAABB|nr:MULTISPECIES: type IV secretion system protein VirB10 [Agrobacterium]QCL77448.1 TrbI/VirB10 family protein [Agrobacterium tumefaciens]CUX72295.1 Type IV secretion protein AvhB10 [Agrobacterium sp. NCPPB 925]